MFTNPIFILFSLIRCSQVQYSLNFNRLRVWRTLKDPIFEGLGWKTNETGKEWCLWWSNIPVNNFSKFLKTYEVELYSNTKRTWTCEFANRPAPVSSPQHAVKEWFCPSTLCLLTVMVMTFMKFNVNLDKRQVIRSSSNAPMIFCNGSLRWKWWICEISDIYKNLFSKLLEHRCNANFW